MNKVAENRPTDAVDRPSRQVRLLRNSVGRAVPISKGFELSGEEVVVQREGNRFIIKTVPSVPFGATVVSGEAKFLCVPGLRVENWLAAADLMVESAD